MSAKPLAYQIKEDCEGTSVILYATHRATAQNYGALHLGQEFQDVRCQRAAQYDDLYPNGPSQEQLFEDGWWFSCSMCYHGQARLDCGGKALDGNFYCQECYEGFTAMKPMWKPSHSLLGIGDSYVVDPETDEWVTVPPKDSELPLKMAGRHRIYEWFSPYR